MDVPEVSAVLRAQSGVVARRQLLGVGLASHDVARLLRRGGLVSHHPGVYVEHNGPLTWTQRAWAGVLSAWPAALCLESARLAHEGTEAERAVDTGELHVVVARGRHLASAAGVRLHRSTFFPDHVQWSAAPPRTRYDDTVVDLAVAARSELDAVAALARACATRRTTAARLQAVLGHRSAVARRAWLHDVLDDVASGTCSVLEHGYLTRVVRPHGLPEGRRQVLGQGAGGRVWRDVELGGLSMVVELDGVMHHASAQAHSRDLDRDLVAAASSELLTVRLGWTQVFATACRTASHLGQLMRRRGWAGVLTRCPECL